MKRATWRAFPFIDGFSRFYSSHRILLPLPSNIYKHTRAEGIGEGLGLYTERGEGKALGGGGVIGFLRSFRYYAYVAALTSLPRKMV
jgi:hypothetical protein